MRLTRHIRHNAVGYVALFIALGGSSAYAATELAPLSVGTKHLKPSAVNSAKVKDRSLLARDFARGQLPRGERGPAGPRGVQGPKGSDGAQGPPGMSGYEIVQGPEETAGDFPIVGAGADCPAGKKVVGGGAGLTQGGGTAGQAMPTLYHSAPSGDDKWLAFWNRGELTTVKVRAWAICATPQP